MIACLRDKNQELRIKRDRMSVKNKLSHKIHKGGSRDEAGISSSTTLPFFRVISAKCAFRDIALQYQPHSSPPRIILFRKFAVPTTTLYT